VVGLRSSVGGRGRLCWVENLTGVSVWTNASCWTVTRRPATRTPSRRRDRCSNRPGQGSPVMRRCGGAMGVCWSAMAGAGCAGRRGVGRPRRGVGRPRRGVGRPRRGAVLDNPAAFQHQQPVGHHHRLSGWWVTRRVGPAKAARWWRSSARTSSLVRASRVEGFVEQQQSRVGGEGSGERDSPGLAAGQLGGFPLGEIGDSESGLSMFRSISEMAAHPLTERGAPHSGATSLSASPRTIDR